MVTVMDVMKMALVFVFGSLAMLVVVLVVLREVPVVLVVVVVVIVVAVMDVLKMVLVALAILVVLVVLVVLSEAQVVLDVLGRRAAVWSLRVVQLKGDAAGKFGTV